MHNIPGIHISSWPESLHSSMHAVQIKLQQELALPPYLAAEAELPTYNAGKLLRPALLLLSASTCGELTENCITAAVAVEAIHTASLLHDDVLDNTSLRRGQASVNAVHGNRYAILYGDYILAKALSMIASTDEAALWLVISQTTEAMSNGQLLEMHHRGDPITPLNIYEQIIAGKTASLIAACCQIGAILGGGNQTEIESLRQYGYNLGIVFQIHDDMLDIWGEQTQTGKPTHSDAASGIYTLPILLALQTATPPLHDQLQDILNRFPTEPDIAALHSILEQTQAYEQTISYQHRYIKEALDSLKKLPHNEASSYLASLLAE